MHRSWRGCTPPVGRCLCVPPRGQALLFKLGTSKEWPGIVFVELVVQ